MDEFSVLIGGKAGEGINQAGLLLCHLFNQLGWRVYTYLDYPSLIRGGHNFFVVRAAKNEVGAYSERIDFLLCLNQDTVDLHKKRLRDKGQIIYDSDTVKAKGIGLPLSNMVKEEGGRLLMRNSAIIGAFSKVAGIEWRFLERVLRREITKEVEINLKLAHKGYNRTERLLKIPCLRQRAFSVVSGSEAISEGLVQAGLNTYIAYPMTPSSGILHYLAQSADRFRIKVIHPENEIAVILMALGFSYTGTRCAVGTSGGGFCLMAEGLSLAAMAELPVVIIVAQRPGPSTGMPTYTAQADLNFVLNAGHGEFIRFVVAPGDAKQAYWWSHCAMNIAIKFQMPCIVLTDKLLNEAVYTLDIAPLRKLKPQAAIFWDKRQPYKRYLNTPSGISPLAFMPDRDSIVKVNSYEHDEYGITTEEPRYVELMYKKRMRKEKYLLKELNHYKTVEIGGKLDSSSALLCWGSNRGVCIEVAKRLGLKAIQIVVLSPFPARQFQDALKGVKRIIAIENNATAQLVKLISRYGFGVNEMVLKYNGRPFSVEELEGKIRKI